MESYHRHWNTRIIHGSGSKINPIKDCYEPNHYVRDCENCTLRFECASSPYNVFDINKECYVPTRPLQITCGGGVSCEKDS